MSQSLADNPLSNPDLLLGYPVYLQTRPLSTIDQVVDFHWQPPGFAAADMHDLQPDSELMTLCYPGKKNYPSWHFRKSLFYYPKHLNNSFRIWREAINRRNEFLLDQSKYQWTADVWLGPTAVSNAPFGMRKLSQDLPDRPSAKIGRGRRRRRSSNSFTTSRRSWDTRTSGINPTSQVETVGIEVRCAVIPVNDILR